MAIRSIRYRVFSDDPYSKKHFYNDPSGRRRPPKSFGDLRRAVDEYMWELFEEGRFPQKVCYLRTADIFQQNFEIETEIRSPSPTAEIPHSKDFCFTKEKRHLGVFVHSGKSPKMIMALRADSLVPRETLFFAESERHWKPCIRIGIQTTQAGLTPEFQRAVLTAGFVSTDFLGGFPVRICPKQTARQRWASDFFFSLGKVILNGAEPTDSKTFVAVKRLPISADLRLDRLGATILSGFWRNSGTPNKLKVFHLEQFGASHVWTANNFGKFQEELGLQVLS